MAHEGREHEVLSDRAQTLLRILIESYIRDGQPVGSRVLSRDSGLQLSSATIRNVMADLEEYGFVSSPHTSAGRIPTDQQRFSRFSARREVGLSGGAVREIDGHIGLSERRSQVGRHRDTEPGDAGKLASVSAETGTSSRGDCPRDDNVRGFRRRPHERQAHATSHAYDGDPGHQATSRRWRRSALRLRRIPARAARADPNSA